MELWQWALLALIVVILVVAVATWLNRRRSAQLRDQFGDEYDRTLERSGNKHQAEVDLRERTKDRDRLDIRPLTPAAAERYSKRWQEIQARFVDEPSQSVADAAVLLKTVMRERGYPEDFDEHVDVISVDHPNVVENYRVADDVRVNAAAGLASTEELREALVRYRSLFDELLETDDDDVEVDDEAVVESDDTVTDIDARRQDGRVAGGPRHARPAGS